MTGWLGAREQQSFVSLFEGASPLGRSLQVRRGGRHPINVKISEQSGPGDRSQSAGAHPCSKAEVSALEAAAV